MTRSRVGVRLAPIAVAPFPCATAAQESLPDDQIAPAIVLGQAGTVPVVKVSTFGGDFDMYIVGPVARIAAAANEATKRYRPFDLTDVTPDMAAPVYRVTVHRAMSAERTLAEHIVLQPKGATGMDGAIQPLPPSDPRLRIAALFERRFDRLPDSDFQVVVVKGDRPQICAVSPNDPAKIR